MNSKIDYRLPRTIFQQKRFSPNTNKILKRIFGLEFQNPGQIPDSSTCGALCTRHVQKTPVLYFLVGEFPG